MRAILLIIALLPTVAALADQPGTVYTVATSHLDTQWRWTIQATIDEYLLDTLDDNFALLEQYPDYVFSFEGAFRYQLIKEYYPERYQRMKRYIDQGRWRVCGSWLDAVDVNMPSPEALYRHALYGNGYFDREFGTRSVDVFLPDCFGFGYALPAIMAHSGLTGFSTQKLSWGSAYGTPFDLGRWRGVDGSEVLAAVNPGAYVSDLEADLSRDADVQAAIARTVEAGGPPIAFKWFGTGDTGGAPGESSVAQLAASVASDSPVTVLPAGADQIFRDLTPAQAATLPVYDGELVMTSHGVGCYTSQAAMKRWNRRCEVLGDAAERAAALAWWLGAADYPHAALERAWSRFLWHGFHDDLTGTSIPEAYTFSWNDMLLSQQEFAQIIESSLAAVVAQMDTDVDGIPLVLFNPLGFDRTEVVTVEAMVPSPLSSGRAAARIVDATGREVPVLDVATLASHRSRIMFEATVPANGVAIYGVRPGAPTREVSTTGWDPASGTLETTRYRLQLGEAGLTSLVDKQTGRELLTAPPRLQLLHNEPLNWAAWEIDHDDIMAAPYAEVPLGGVPEAVQVADHAARLTFTHQAAGSTFHQTLTISGDRLDWDLDIDWATKGTLLKAAFFTTAADTAVTYDLGLGTIRRGLNRPLLYEVPAQRWADLTDMSGDFGLTLMNDGRHGWDHPEPGTLRLTLLHTPAVNAGWRWIDDQKSQDLGRHRVTVSMMGHGPGWRTAANRQADALNQPILAFTGVGRHGGPVGRTLSLLSVVGDRPEVAVRAVKKAEDSDWVVVRLQELTGAPAAGITLQAVAPILEVRELRADEVTIPTGGDLRLDDGLVTCDLAAYQPRTLALRLMTAPGKAAAVRLSSTPLPLPWNADVLSTRDQPTDGDLDGSGVSLPSFLLPAEPERDGARYATGPRGPGQANAVRCEGQLLELPRDHGATELRLLACAIDGPREPAFRVGLREVKPWLPDGRQWFGQWDSRVIGHDVVHERADLVPAYTQDADLGWVVTHRHDATGAAEPYVFTHLYVVTLPVADIGEVRLPDDPAVLLLGASLVTPADRLSPACDLVDRPASPSVAILAERRAFVDTVTVTLETPNRATTITVQRDGGEPVVHDGQPLVLTDTTELTVTARGPFAEPAVRTATFTRRDPWPASSTSADLTPGLATAVYHGAWELLPDWATLEPVTTLVSDQVGLPASVREEDIGLVMRGWIDVPVAGVYRFWLTSDDGSRLWVSGHQVVDHDGLHGASAVWGDAPLAAGRHPLLVEFFQHLGGRDLKLEWSGPGFGRREVAGEVLEH